MTYDREIMRDGVAFLNENISNNNQDSNDGNPKPGGGYNVHKVDD